MTVYYGALVSDSLISGTYSNTVNYTVVADATDTTTISPTSQNTLAAGTEITITTPLYTNMSDLGTITTTVGGTACTDMTTSTATGVLVVKCKTPAKTAIGNYDVVVNVPKFNKTYTVKYGYKKTYTLTYHSTSTATSTATCTTGTATDSCEITLGSASVTRSGMSFAGWAMQDGEDMTVVTNAVNSKITMTKNIALYGVWSVKLTYNPNNGTSGSVSSQTCNMAYNESNCAISIDTKANPTRTNYTFAGWGTTTASTTTAYSPGSTYTFSANTTVYAIWGVNIHALSVTSVNNKYGTVNTTVTGGMTGAAGSSVNVKAFPTTGYVFAGWVDKSTDKVVSSSANYTFTMPDGNLSLEARFSFDITSIQEVKVLNVYPDRTGDGTYDVKGEISFTSAVDNTSYTMLKSASLKMWMEMAITGYDKGYGQGKIKVTSVAQSVFNSDPNTYLLDANGEYKYDVFFQGTWDANASNQDYSESARDAVAAFIESGRGIIMGHDTIRPANSVLWTLKDYFKASQNATTPNPSGTTVRIIKDGIFLTHPYNIGSINTTLEVPVTHVDASTQADGDVWMEFDGYDRGARNFFLATYRNCAMIQTGHSNGEGSPDEQKIIANLIFYMYSYYLINQ